LKKIASLWKIEKGISQETAAVQDIKKGRGIRGKSTITMS
jgi:hypothetical protein